MTHTLSVQRYKITYNNGFTITLEATSRRQARSEAVIYIRECGRPDLTITNIEEL